MGTFLLERYAPAHRFPQTFSITRVIEDPDRDLAIYFDYEVASGLDERTADLVANRFLDSLPKKEVRSVLHPRCLPLPLRQLPQRA